MSKIKLPSNFTGPQSTLSFRVRYAETDAMAVAHHSNYAVWFEMGRTDLMHTLGLPYTEVEARGYYIMLSSLNTQFRRAARYDDVLTLTSSIIQLRSRAITFSYQLHKQHPDNSIELMATGETAHVFTNKEYQPCRLPEDILEVLGSRE